MTSFRYEAVDTGGRRKRGVVTADTQRKARREIVRSGLTPLSIRSVSEKASASGKGRAKKASRTDVIAATRQLATLIDASMPVEEAIGAVATQLRGAAIADILFSVRGRIVEGWRMSDALGEYPGTFPPLYRGIVAAGESSGELGPVLLRLADMLEKNRAMTMRAVTALIYPAAVAVIAIVVVLALMNFVVPKIVGQFESSGADLPLLTVIVIAASDFIQVFWPLMLIALIGAGVGFYFAVRQPKTRLAMDRFLLRVPVLGKLARELDAARFARTLSTLFASGTPLLDALRAARRTVTNTYIREKLDDMLTSVREGASLSAGVRRAEVFPPMMASMIAAGEQAGKLPDLLERTADQMEAGFDAAVSLALKLLEPAVIVGLGVIVMVIVLAIMMPILQINTLAL